MYKLKKEKGITLLALVITIIMLINKNNQQSNPQNTEAVQEVTEYSAIDLENTNNVDVKDGVKSNTSSKLAEEKTYKKMKIKDIKLISEGGITKFTATVENTTNSNYEGGGITIIFTNEDGSEYSRLETILPAIEAGKSNEIDAGTTADIANAYDFEIE